MKKEDLIARCRYYKGEEENPYEDVDQNKAMLWFYEQAFCIDCAEGSNKILSEYEKVYLSLGLGSLDPDSTIPVSMAAYIFNGYAKGCYSMADAAEGFREFYKKYYGTGDN